MEKSKKKKIIKITAIAILLILIIVIVLLYMFQKNFRNWVDIKILNKNITEEDIATIDLNIDKENQVYVYNKYIALLNEQTITLYNNYGNEITNIKVNINSALFDSSDKYLALAENGGNEICLILDKTYLWSNKVEGNILQISVNKNGYVAVITKDNTYSSILTMYNSDGEELFKSYFSSTKVIDVSISEDNKYVAVGEIDSSGVLMQSNVKIISIENAKNNSEDYIVYTRNAEKGTLLIDIIYQSKNKLVCMYDNSIEMIENEQEKDLLKITNQITFASTGLNNNISYIEEETSGVFKTNSIVKIVNIQNNNTSTYNIEEVPKELYTNDNVIAVNVGTEIYFINTSGWLLRKYSTKQEITKVLFSNNIAGVVYKDKIIIINL